ncbi:hypothetical protein [Streptomyces sp. NPDC058623]|uniref:hypothetical protein n=1 Tax=Streptomyces sp. NPDC058623 TaxID=3346563 RepID=UPI0036683B87
MAGESSYPVSTEDPMDLFHGYHPDNLAVTPAPPAATHRVAAQWAADAPPARVGVTSHALRMLPAGFRCLAVVDTVYTMLLVERGGAELLCAEATSSCPGVH